MSVDPNGSDAVSDKPCDTGLKIPKAGFFLSILKDEGRTFAGFTLLELMVVIAILGALSAISIPMYIGYVRQARETKCIADIQIIARVIKVYQHDLGELPDSLAEVGQQNVKDPWGNPYQYFNVEKYMRKKEENQKKGITGPPEKDPKTQNPGEAPRKDRMTHPINNDFDLYSMGPDGRSRVA
ncbi:MAG: prepilin-type N-terminal cleavage/methylation domain-containing protein, partial [Desulfobacterales bacterium]